MSHLPGLQRVFSAPLDATLSRALDQLESTPPHALLVGPPLSGKTSLLFTYAHSAAAEGKRSLFFSYRSRPLVPSSTSFVGGPASAAAKKPTHSSSLEHHLPALPRGLDMRDEILERIDIKYVSSLDEFLFVLAHLHQYPSDRIPEVIIVDDFLALCCADVPDERESCRRISRAMSLINNAAQFCSAHAKRAAPSSSSLESTAATSSSSCPNILDPSDEMSCPVLLSGDIGGHDSAMQLLRVEAVLGRFVSTVLAISVKDPSARSFRLSPITDIVTYLARKNLGGPAADVPSAAAEKQDHNCDGAVSIHFVFRISSAHLELQAIEIN